LRHVDSAAYAHIRDEITHRAEGKPVWLITWKNGYELQPITRAAEISGMAIAELVPLLRTAEMHRLLSRPGVVLPKNDEYHYRGPNGGHYQSFARIGPAFTSPADLDGIAFWFLP